MCSAYKSITLFNSVDDDNPYCCAVECIDKRQHSELVWSTYKFIAHINSIDNDDPNCCAVECIDQDQYSELVCSTFKYIPNMNTLNFVCVILFSNCVVCTYVENEKLIVYMIITMRSKKDCFSSFCFTKIYWYHTIIITL